jgi:hypothetical protein
MDINNYLTLPSIAYDFLLKHGAYNGVMSLSGVARKFISKCQKGGRCMLSENKKVDYIATCMEEALADFDGVSQYVSSMNRINGFVKGCPHEIMPEQRNMEFLKTVDEYYVEVKILSHKTNRKFPLFSYMSSKKSTVYTNEMDGDSTFLGRVALEDLIEHQQITFEIIRGYYFNEGYNPRIKELIKDIFEKRLELKKQGNPAEVLYKLIGNSSFGKNGLKQHNEKTVICDNKEAMDLYVAINQYWISKVVLIQGSNKYRITVIQPVQNHFNCVHISVQILDMAKRMMNEVMCLAEDNNIRMFYTDTDSIHIMNSGIPLLAKLFEEKYNRVLIGKSMGQFHSDFSLDGTNGKDVLSMRFIGLAKKIYVDLLVGTFTDKDGVISDVSGIHKRMKGVRGSTIDYTIKKLSEDKNSGVKNVIDLYSKHFKSSDTINYDLTEKNQYGLNGVPCFKSSPEFIVNTLDVFTRNISIPSVFIDETYEVRHAEKLRKESLSYKAYHLEKIECEDEIEEDF